LPNGDWYNRDMSTSKQVKRVPNPTGKGGFQERPEDRNNGHWSPENTISYQYRRFLKMSPEELRAFANVPENERTVAMDIAYSQVLASRKSLPHTKEITDRTEGKAQQQIDLTTGGDKLNIALVEFVDGNNQDEDSTTDGV